MDKIECPKCHHKFELTETLAGPLIAAARAEANRNAADEIKAAEERIKVAAETKAREDSRERLTAALEAAEASQRLAEEGAALLLANNKKLAEAQAAQADALRKSRELDEARRELELTVQRKVTEGAAAVREEARRVAEEAIGLRVAEREQTIETLRKALEDAQRKAAQGSQQAQGEVQELALEAALREAFPLDTVEPVAKGVLGADCVQTVYQGSGEKPCGKIIFESKRTKNWSEGWVSKLKDDQRAAQAEIAVIVTAVLPKDVVDFGLYEGVWVVSPRYAVNLAAVLRVALQEVAAARAAGQGLETKAELIYGYMTGPRFKSRIQAIVEAFTVMREDLDTERRAIQKQWAKREAQIERVMLGTAGMYGDLQAIAGKSLTELEGLDIKSLGATLE